LTAVADTRPSIGLDHAVHGVAATVTPPNAAGYNPLTSAITTTVIARPAQPRTTGDEMRVAGFAKPFGLRRDHVSSAPQGTLIEVLEGEDTGRYTVDAVELVEADEIRVLATRLAD